MKCSPKSYCYAPTARLWTFFFIVLDVCNILNLCDTMVFITWAILKYFKQKKNIQVTYYTVKQNNASIFMVTVLCRGQLKRQLQLQRKAFLPPCGEQQTQLCAVQEPRVRRLAMETLMAVTYPSTELHTWLTQPEVDSLPPSPSTLWILWKSLPVWE